MKSKKKVYLIGMPGCGKSTLGKALAKLTSLEFIDLDQTIEDFHKKPIAEIINEEGEDMFRQWEKQALYTTTTDCESFLMATGGGAPCFYQNIQWMLENGLIIYIDTPVEVITRRLFEDQTRPLIKNKNGQELLRELELLLEKREPYYRQAHLVTKSPEPLELAQEIDKFFEASKN